MLLLFFSNAGRKDFADCPLYLGISRVQKKCRECRTMPLPSYAEFYFYAKFFEIQVLLLVLVPGRNGKQSTTHATHNEFNI